MILALPADGPCLSAAAAGSLGSTGNAFPSEPSMLTRVDTEVAFDWLGGAGGFKGGQGFPVTPTKRDGVSARWTGFLKVPIGEARLTLEANDGARLYIDGKLVVAAENGAPPQVLERRAAATAAFEEGPLPTPCRDARPIGRAAVSPLLAERPHTAPAFPFLPQRGAHQRPLSTGPSGAGYRHLDRNQRRQGWDCARGPWVFPTGHREARPLPGRPPAFKFQRPS